MDFAQYPQLAPAQHAHNQHIQAQYPSSSQHPGAGATITSPSRIPLHSQHAVYLISPFLSSQPHQAWQNQCHQQQGAYQQPYYRVVSCACCDMSEITPQAAAVTSSGAYFGYQFQGSTPSPTSPEILSYIKRQCQGPTSSQPHHVNNQIQNTPIMSQQVRSRPAVLNSQPIMNHKCLAGPPNQPPQSHELVSAVVNLGIYVNKKQFYRILKRREAREKCKKSLQSPLRKRKSYVHESRHIHTVRRPRGKGGRFLSANEIAKLREQKVDSSENGDKVT